MRRTTIHISGRPLAVEVAETPEEQALGLMFRRELGGDEGMLFCFGRPRAAAMWMKNCFIALDIAFFDAAGVLMNVVSLGADDPRRAVSNGSALYAVEARRGWFAKNGLAMEPAVLELGYA